MPHVLSTTPRRAFLQARQQQLSSSDDVDLLFGTSADFGVTKDAAIGVMCAARSSEVDSQSTSKTTTGEEDGTGLEMRLGSGGIHVISSAVNGFTVHSALYVVPLNHANPSSKLGGI